MVKDAEKDLKECNSCKKGVDEGYVEFSCPSCGKEDIIRCRSCRVLGVNYTCPKCGFTGP